MKLNTKYLYAREADNEALCFDAKNLVSARLAADTTDIDGTGSLTAGTLLTLFFAGGRGNFSTMGETDDMDQMQFTITQNKEKEVLKTICEAIEFGKESFIVLSDNIDSVHISPDISANVVLRDANG